MTRFKPPLLSRRRALSLMTATFVTTPGLPALAKTDTNADDYGRPRGSGRKRKFTQSEFLRLTTGEVRHLSYLVIIGRKFSITGFSDNMAVHVIKMADNNRRWTNALMRRLRATTKKRDRQMILDNEERRVERTIKKFEAELQELDRLGRRSAAGETSKQLRLARGYLKRLKIWRDFPDEGTF